MQIASDNIVWILQNIFTVLLAFQKLGHVKNLFFRPVLNGLKEEEVVVEDGDTTYRNLSQVVNVAAEHQEGGWEWIMRNFKKMIETRKIELRNKEWEMTDQIDKEEDRGEKKIQKVEKDQGGDLKDQSEMYGKTGEIMMADGEVKEDIGVMKEKVLTMN